MQKKSLIPRIQKLNQEQNRSIVILDDDPTGNQTVYDVPVLSAWDEEILLQELNHNTAVFFILTNSRSLHHEKAAGINRDIARNLQHASQKAGRDFRVISRSDSTLRGHYPAEVIPLKQVLYPDGCLECIIPAFFQGGRYTLKAVHYVREEGRLIPAAQTPFAKDEAFGYRESDLKNWVQEKTRNRIKAKDVLEITLHDIRFGGTGKVMELLSNSRQKVCVVDALEQHDLDVFSMAALKAEQKGLKMLYRTAASFINSYAGIPQRDLIKNIETDPSAEGGGLFIAGSHVPKTTEQINHLLKNTAVEPVEIDVESLLDENQQSAVIAEKTEIIRSNLSRQKDTILYTSRRLIKGEQEGDKLRTGNVISSCLVQIVASLNISPKYILAKGGITSSDIATRALKVKRAMVLGQLLPGVSVWRLGDETLLPGLNYIVFPGNVGNKTSLTDIHKKLQNQ